jgi:hypothetical protein
LKAEYEQIDQLPATAGLFAEPELLAAYRNSLKQQGKGPHLSMRVLEEYIRSEQQLGRIDSTVDAKFAAGLMLLPRSLAGTGEVDVSVSVKVPNYPYGGRFWLFTSNTVKVRFR